MDDDVMTCQNCLRLEQLVIEARAAIPSSQHSGAIGYAAACARADRAEHTHNSLVTALRWITEYEEPSGNLVDYGKAIRLQARAALAAATGDSNG